MSKFGKTPLLEATNSQKNPHQIDIEDDIDAAAQTHAQTNQTTDQWKSACDDQSIN